MAGTPTAKRRSRKGAADIPFVMETFEKDVVLLRPARPDTKRTVLDERLEAEGFTTFEAKAKALNYPSVGMLHRALKHGAPVSSALIVAIRLRYPDSTYEEMFTEGRILTERKVSVDATADLAA